MKRNTIHKLCCPFDKSDLALHIVAQDLEENIHEGLLTCGTCKRYYPIIKGVPIMNPDDYRERILEEPVLERWQKDLPELRVVKDFRLENP